MNNPDIKIIDLIDALTRSNINFVLYRLPWTDACYLVLQKDGELEELSSLEELNGRKGFVMAPFSCQDDKKILLIRPDIYSFDWDEITSSLEEFCKDYTTDRVEPAEIKERKDDGLADYKECFTKYHDALAKKKFTKLVLSRYATEKIPQDISPLKVFTDACNSYPRMFIYLCHTTKAGTWIGSTPEVILSGHTDNWHTVALAGTMPIKDNVIPTEWSNKNINEQKYVAEYIRKTIKKIDQVGKIDEKGPYTARAGHLVHRKTDFFFTMKNHGSMGTVLEKLHPTPAICGVPKEEAQRFITDNENYQRGYYSGIIGWLDAENGTDLYVNLRCMQIGKDYARLYAGGGLLDSSTLEDEWEETEKKLATMRKVINDNSKQ